MSGHANKERAFSMTSRSARFAAGTCPCCGQSYQFPKVHVSLDFNSISFRGSTIFLTPALTEIAWILAERMPNIARRSFVLERLYGGTSVGGGKSIDVLLCHLRKRVALIGLGIDTVPSVGWRLIITERAAADASPAAPEPAPAHRRPRARAGSLSSERVS